VISESNEPNTAVTSFFDKPVSSAIALMIWVFVCLVAIAFKRGAATAFLAATFFFCCFLCSLFGGLS
jgi:hypothetical protein